ncbi:restriction endonuclease [Barnesiella intestinihominis]|uniref:restriction endonuclease n=1 Tax=Barnesiella intestinihominis TaxID=487174 RepID=UPI00266CA2D1|nr:restriction endonuclease [Barnesiella intestinihominis]
MKPREYEEYIQGLFNKQGYTTQLTPQSGDYGVDIFAIKGEEKIAIQVKMYGNSNRKVNRSMIMELHGSKDYFGCNKAILVTNGEIMPDAIEVAKRLQIGLQIIDCPNKTIKIAESTLCSSESQKAQDMEFQTVNIFINEEYSFDFIWEKYIMPLKGKTLYNRQGKNIIKNVDWAGVTRITSKGNISKIDIEPFKSAVRILLEKGEVTRDYINQNYKKRASSGIVLILSQVPFFKLDENPIKLTFKLKE